MLGAALLLAGAAALVVPLDRHARLDDQLAAEHEKAASVDRAGARRQARPTRVDDRQLATEIDRANAVVRQLSVPWSQLFMALESCDCKDVALLSVDPDIDKSIVKIGVEARTLDAMLGYVAHLEAQSVFGAVSLVSHLVQQQDVDRPVRFIVLAEWSSGK